MIGRTIVFEGIDGSGKTTHALMLKKWLEGQNKSVFYAKAPKGSALGEQIFSYILKEKNLSLNAEMLAFLLMNALFYNEVVAPRISAGDIVIFDRWLGSFLNYFHYVHNLPLRFLERSLTNVANGFKPDLTIMIDIPAVKAVKRIKKTGKLSRFDTVDLNILRRQRFGFKRLAKKFKWPIINGDKDILQVHDDICSLI